MRAEISPGALADLDDIEEYIARDNPMAAESWIRRLLEKVERAAESPRAGRIVPEIGDEDLREVFLKTYRIVYRIEAARILVLAVFEGHRHLRSIAR